MRYGTHHFEDFNAAREYYRALGYTGKEVLEGIEIGVIALGEPVLKPGQTLKLHPTERRYFIKEA